MQIIILPIVKDQIYVPGLLKISVLSFWVILFWYRTYVHRLLYLVPVYNCYGTLRFTVFVLCDDVVLILCVIFLSVVTSAKYYNTYLLRCVMKKTI